MQQTTLAQNVEDPLLNTSGHIFPQNAQKGDMVQKHQNPSPKLLFPLL